MPRKPPLAILTTPSKAALAPTTLDIRSLNVREQRYDASQRFRAPSEQVLVVRPDNVRWSRWPSGNGQSDTIPRDQALMLQQLSKDF